MVSKKLNIPSNSLLLSYSNFFFTLLVLCSAGVTGACSEVSEEKREFRKTQQTLEERTLLRHPLIGLNASAGRVPLFDVKDSPRGLRYAVAVAAWQGAPEEEVQQFSGLIELEREPFRQNEGEEEKEESAIPEATAREGIVTPALRSAAAEKGLEPVEFVAHLERLPGLNLVHEIQRAIAEGRIETEEDLQAFKRSYKIARQVNIEATQRDALARIHALGGIAKYRCRNRPCLVVELPGTKVDTFLAQQRNVIAADIPRAMEELSLPPNYNPNTWVDGRDVRRGSQIEQFITAGYNGKVPGTAVELAQFEAGALPIPNHVGFNNGPAGNPGINRLLGRYICGPHATYTHCYPASSGALPIEHGTLVAGLLARWPGCECDRLGWKSATLWICT